MIQSFSPRLIKLLKDKEAEKEALKAKIESLEELKILNDKIQFINIEIHNIVNEEKEIIKKNCKHTDNSYHTKFLIETYSEELDFMTEVRKCTTCGAQFDRVVKCESIRKYGRIQLFKYAVFTNTLRECHKYQSACYPGGDGYDWGESDPQEYYFDDSSLDAAVSKLENPETFAYFNQVVSFIPGGESTSKDIVKPCVGGEWRRAQKAYSIKLIEPIRRKTPEPPPYDWGKFRSKLRNVMITLLIFSGIFGALLWIGNQQRQQRNSLKYSSTYSSTQMETQRPITQNEIQDGRLVDNRIITYEMDDKHILWRKIIDPDMGNKETKIFMGNYSAYYKKQ